jgi:oligoribonuclease NrnB/cAMP/cGMP phosphodiesterase (DHH superfamily)
MVDYHEFSDKVVEVMRQKPSLLLISDVWAENLSNEALNLLQQYKGILYIFDHHKTTEDIQKSLVKPEGAVINGTGTSATKYMADFFNVNYPVIEYIDAYDMSGTIEGIPGKLNALFWELKDKGYSRISEMFKRVPFGFSDEEDDLYNLIIREQQDYYEEVISSGEFETIEDLKCVFVNIYKDHAYVSKQILKDNDIAIMYNEDKPKISIRSNGDFAGRLAEELGGGGHSQAAGCPAVEKKIIVEQLKRIA